jgi:hypothetical protein
MIVMMPVMVLGADFMNPGLWLPAVTAPVFIETRVSVTTGAGEGSPAPLNYIAPEPRQDLADQPGSPDRLANVRDLDNQLAAGSLGFDGAISIAHRLQRVAVRVHQRHDLALIGKPRGLFKDRAVVDAALARQEWQKREDAGICCRAERERAKRMRAPPEDAQDMAEAADRLERGVERGSAGGIVNEIEAPAFRVGFCQISGQLAESATSG